ncbi:MAG: hypothetical protein V2A56_11005 [bacterium]
MKPTITELALTLGTWGATPPDEEVQRRVVEQLAGWAARTRIILRVEVYMDAPQDRNALHALVEHSRKSENVIPIARLEPRTDRWRYLREAGVKEAVFEVPVGEKAAAARFTPHGALRSPGFAAEAVRDAALSGIVPEIALVDICRANDEAVQSVIRGVQKELHPRGAECRWRLVDKTGLGYPLPGSRRPRSMSGWVRWMKREFGISSARVNVQASDLRGLALANTLAGVQEGAGAVSSLFGLGHSSGWAATEVLLLHLWRKMAGIDELLELQDVLDAERRRDDYRPVSGRRVWQMLGGTTPEDLSAKLDAQLAIDPKRLTDRKPEPLLTALSGHAGLLHLLHRNLPGRQFESDDPESLAISARFEEQFTSGRQQPVAWSELAPKVKASSLSKGEDRGEPPGRTPTHADDTLDEADL